MKLTVSAPGDETPEHVPPAQGKSEALAEDNDDDDTSAKSTINEKLDSRWRVQDIVFAFGPQKSYFMSTSLGSWRYWGPEDIAISFDKREINQPAAIALTPEGDYVFVFEEHDGSMSVKHSMHEQMIPSSEAAAFLHTRTQYSQLYDFVRESKEGDVRRKLSFAVGPGGSWFARRGEQVSYHRLPDDFVTKIKEREAMGSYPYQVALGMHGSYVVVWSDDTWSWNLNGYSGLARHLELADGINTIVLSPLDCREWFLVNESGHVLWALYGDTGQLYLIEKDAQAYMQREARRTGKILRPSLNGELTVITPDTHFDQVPRAYPGVSTILRQLGFATNDLGWDADGSVASLMKWKWSKPGDIRDKQSLIAIGAAAATSAVVVGFVAYPGRRNTFAASGSSALSTGLATRLAGTPIKRAVLAAGMAAVGTGALCSWLSE